MTSYHLPHALRPLLAQPFGPVHATGEALRKCAGRTVVSVGDVVTQMFLDAAVVPKVMVIDGHTQRGAVGLANALPRFARGPGGKVEGALVNLPSFGVKRVEVENPPAAITHKLLMTIEAAFRTKGSTLINVIGEEDLAALPAMIMAPLGAAVCYGQPNEGVVVVIVTPVVRQRAKDILTQMEVK